MKHILALFMMFFAATAYAQTDNNSVYTEKKTGILVASDNPQFTIKLKSNPTTGYSWFLREYNGDLIQPITHSYTPPANANLIGAAGVETWVFQVKSAGFSVPQQTMIHLAYSRPWEVNERLKPLVFQVSTKS